MVLKSILFPCRRVGNAWIFGMVSHFPGMEVGSSSWRIEVADPIKAQPLLNLLNVKYMLVQREKMGVITPELPVFDQSDFVTLWKIHTSGHGHFLRIRWCPSNRNLNLSDISCKMAGIRSLR